MALLADNEREGQGSRGRSAGGVAADGAASTSTSPSAKAAGALEYPIRWYIAVLLSDRPMSAAELGAVVELKPAAVRRHLREMRAAGVLELVEVRRRRNSNEQVYGLAADFVVTERERAGLSPEVRRRIDGYTLKVALGEVLRSMRSGPDENPDERLDTCMTRVPMELDEEGWTEIAQIHLESYERVMEARERARERLREGSESEPIRATSLLVFFEVSPPR